MDCRSCEIRSRLTAIWKYLTTPENFVFPEHCRWMDRRYGRTELRESIKKDLQIGGMFLLVLIAHVTLMALDHMLTPWLLDIFVITLYSSMCFPCLVRGIARAVLFKRRFGWFWRMTR